LLIGNGGITPFAPCRLWLHKHWSQESDKFLPDQLALATGQCRITLLND